MKKSIAPDHVKHSQQWQALNEIWRNCSKEQQTELYSQFEIVAQFIKENTLKTCSTAKDEYKYLSEVSQATKEFIISIVDRGEKNIYHSCMAVINNHPTSTKEELITYYLNTYSPKRPYLLEHEQCLREVFDLCWTRTH